MFDPKAMTLVKEVPHTAGFLSGVLDPTTGRFLAGTIDGRILAYDLPDASAPAPLGEARKSYVHLLAALPAQKQIVAAGYDCRLVWLDAATGAQLREADTDARPLGMAISPDERRLAIVGDDRLLRLFDAAIGELLATQGGHPDETLKRRPSSVYSVAFSPDSRLVATGDRTGTILVRDAGTGEVLHTLSAKKFYSDFNKLPDGTDREGEYELGGVRGLLFSPDGRTLIASGMDQYNPNSAGIDGKMGLVGFDLAGGQTSFETTLAKGLGYLQCLAWHPAGWLIAAGGGGAQGSGLGTFCAVELSLMPDGKPGEPVIHELQMTIRAMALAPASGHMILAGMLKTAAAGRLEVWSL